MLGNDDMTSRRNVEKLVKTFYNGDDDCFNDVHDANVRISECADVQMKARIALIESANLHTCLPAGRSEICTLRFWFSENSKYFHYQPGQYKQGGNSYAGCAIHFFCIKHSRIFTFAAGHQEHTDCDQCKPGQHPDIILFGKNRRSRFLLTHKCSIKGCNIAILVNGQWSIVNVKSRTIFTIHY